MSDSHAVSRSQNEGEAKLPVVSAEIPGQLREELEGGPLLAAIQRVEEKKQSMSQATHTSHNKQHNTNKW